MGRSAPIALLLVALGAPAACGPRQHPVSPPEETCLPDGGPDGGVPDAGLCKLGNGHVCRCVP